MQQNYTTKQLEKIKEYASVFMRVTDIAILLDLDIDKLKNDIQTNDNEAFKAYHKGKLETVLTYQTQEVQLGLDGSPLSAELIKEFITNQNMDE